MKKYKYKNVTIKIPKIKKALSSILESKCDCLSGVMNLYKKVTISVIILIVCIITEFLLQVHLDDSHIYDSPLNFLLHFLVSTSPAVLGVFLSSLVVFEYIPKWINKVKVLHKLNSEINYLKDLKYLNKLCNRVEVLVVYENKEGCIVIEYIENDSSICKNRSLFKNCDVDIKSTICADIDKTIVQFSVDTKMEIIKPYKGNADEINY